MPSGSRCMPRIISVPPRDHLLHQEARRAACRPCARPRRPWPPAARRPGLGGQVDRHAADVALVRDLADRIFSTTRPPSVARRRLGLGRRARPRARARRARRSGRTAAWPALRPASRRAGRRTRAPAAARPRRGRVGCRASALACSMPRERGGAALGRGEGGHAALREQRADLGRMRADVGDHRLVANAAGSPGWRRPSAPAWPGWTSRR